MDGKDDRVCSVETWRSLVDQLTSHQLDELRGTPIECMLEMPIVATQKTLVRYMVEIYNPKTKRFVVKPKVGEFTASPADVECIYGLVDRGLSCEEIIDQEGYNVKVPTKFLNKKTKRIENDDLISKIVETGITGDDFVRMTGLVLFGTVVAPHNRTSVPKIYYILVQDLERFKELNLNEFTLNTLMMSVRQVRNGTSVTEWPMGNTSLLQVHIIFEDMHPEFFI